jgi:hypothetical protein
MYPSFEMLNGHDALLEVDVLRGQGHGLRDATPETGKEPDEQTIQEIGGSLLEQFHLFRLKVGLGHRPAPASRAAT